MMMMSRLDLYIAALKKVVASADDPAASASLLSLMEVRLGGDLVCT